MNDPVRERIVQKHVVSREADYVIVEKDEEVRVQ
jgi:hypothetical protein